MYVCTCLQHNSDRHPRKVPVGTHQEDDIGMLVESSGHADPLALTTRQVDALSPKGGTFRFHRPSGGLFLAPA